MLTVGSIRYDLAEEQKMTKADQADLVIVQTGKRV